MDASVALSWCFPEEQTAVSDAILKLASTEQPYVPAIFPVEIGNGLGIALRKGRITEEQVADALDTLRLLRIDVEEVSDLGLVQPLLDHMRTHRLSGYDASYLELADRLGLPLATFDRELAHAARTLGVKLVAGSA